MILLHAGAGIIMNAGTMMIVHTCIFYTRSLCASDIVFVIYLKKRTTPPPSSYSLRAIRNTDVFIGNGHAELRIKGILTKQHVCSMRCEHTRTSLAGFRLRYCIASFRYGSLWTRSSHGLQYSATVLSAIQTYKVLVALTRAETVYNSSTPWSASILKFIIMLGEIFNLRVLCDICSNVRCL